MTMCKLRFNFVLFIWLAISLTTPLRLPDAFAFEDEAIQSGLEMAMIKAAEGALDVLSQKPPSEAIDLGVSQIIADTDKHKVRSNSEPIIRDYYTATLNQVLDTQLQRIHSNMIQIPLKNAKEMNYEWLRNYVNEYLAEKKNRAIQGNLSKHYKKYFKRVRDKAVHLQSAKISAAIYPEQHEIEGIIRSEPRYQKKNELLKHLTERMNGSIAQTLLEEVERSFRAMVSKNIEEGLSQYSSQLEIANASHFPENIITKDQIQQNLESAVYDYIESQMKEKKPGKKVYNLFPTIEKTILENASKQEKQQLIQFIKNHNFKIAPNTLNHIITENFAKHKQPDESLTIFVSQFEKQFNESAIEAYLSKISSTAVAQRFQDTLHVYFEHDADVEGQAKLSLRQVLTPSHTAVRNSISDVQMKTHFPKALSGKWAVGDLLLMRFISNKTKDAGEEFNINTVSECLELEGISDGGTPFNRINLLKECEDNLLQNCKILVREGENAFNGQQKIFDHNKDTYRTEIQKQPRKFSPEGWTNELIGRVTRKWKRSRTKWMTDGIEEPSIYIDEKYTELFTHIKDEIRQLVRDSLKHPVPPPPPDEPQTYARPENGKLIPDSLKHPVAPDKPPTYAAPEDSKGTFEFFSKLLRKLKSLFSGSGDKASIGDRSGVRDSRRDGPGGDPGGGCAGGGGKKDRRKTIVRIYVRDLAKTVAFYQKIEGLEIRETNQTNALVVMDNINVELIHSPQETINHPKVQFVLMGRPKEKIVQNLRESGIIIDEQCMCIDDPNGIGFVFSD